MAKLNPFGLQGTNNMPISVVSFRNFQFVTT